MKLRALVGFLFFMGYCVSSLASFPPITIELDNGNRVSVTASGEPKKMVVRGQPRAAKLAERTDRRALLEASLRSNGLAVEVKTIAGTLAAYRRTVVTVRNTTTAPIIVQKVTLFDGYAPAPDAKAYISGNTDGSVAVFPKAGYYLGIENPLAKMEISTGANSGDVAARWTPDIYMSGKQIISLPSDLKEGDVLTLTAAYTRGAHRADFKAVQWLDTDGKVIAEDRHPGFSGIAASGNIYQIDVSKVPENASSSLTVIYGLEAPGNTDTYGEWRLSKSDLKQTPRVTAWLDRGYGIKPGETWTFSTVIGRFESTQLRRDFQSYLNAERAHPYRVLPHYNSWYDLNIGRNDRPWQDRMDEEECLGTMRAFRDALSKRGVFINSYLWDDGWDNWDSLWDFHPGFPNGFLALAKEAHRNKGASIGVWMSPCGGYGGSQAARVNYAKKQGIISQNEGLLRMSQPTYYAAFRDRCLDMIKKYDMNLFKFDRMGRGHDCDGAGKEHAPDMEAIVRLIDEMRAAKQDVFINCTVGTWASPFWVMFADSIWRGGNDWEGLGPGPERQRWMTYRDNKIHDRFVVPCPLFPLNSMMIHGIIVSKNGPPGCMDVSDSPTSTKAFADEVWTGVACGTGLQEYYITPSLMHESWWDILANGIKWLKANTETLRDVHWIGGDPADGQTYSVYGHASLSDRKGIIILRNPSDREQNFSATPDDLLEMPAARKGTTIVKWTPVYVSEVSLSGTRPAKTSDTFTITLKPFGVYLVELTL